MEQPKKEKKKGTITVTPVATGSLNGDYLELTPEEIKRNKSVKQQSTTDKFKKNLEETQKIKMVDGKAEPMGYEKKLDIAPVNSGRKSREIDGKGNVIREVRAGSDEEKEMIRKHNQQRTNTNRSRQRGSEVVNYQTEEQWTGNPVYEDKLAEQEAGKQQRERMAKKVKVIKK